MILRALCLGLVVSWGGTAVVKAEGKEGTISLNHHANAQIEWIRSHDGFVHADVEFRRLNPNDEASPFGAFTKGFLPKGTQAMVVPRKCLLTSLGETEDTCDTVRNLVKQRALGDASHYAPYVKHLYEGLAMQPLPSAFSNEGKRLIDDVLGMEMNPDSLTDAHFKDFCSHLLRRDKTRRVYQNKTFWEEAYHFVLRRSWDDKMVPVLDMANHRNGRHHNVGTNPVHENQDDISLSAKRDIAAGEQLFLSYNECTDCDFALTYVLPDILRDFGFVERYPQRWRFDNNDNPNYYGVDLVVEIDETVDDIPEGGEPKLELRWLTRQPDTEDLRFLRGQLVRLKGLKIDQRIKKVSVEHEVDTILEFYEAFVKILRYAIWEGEALAQKNKEEHAQARRIREHNEVCLAAEASGGEAPKCSGASLLLENRYDSLEERPPEVEFNELVCDFSRQWGRSYDQVESVKSHYQTYDFHRSSETGDTCVYIDDHLNACSSVRPHYHEVLVHYPASFVDEIKRVIFIGGGDNMLVHEVLKYPSLELVIGFELDQKIVRHSYKQFGTQPYWDDERVHWWFGDAVKSLPMLPQDFLGTFDLVLVDLQSDVIEMLNVTEELDVMDAAMLLLKSDGGVIARNVDYGFDTKHRFTKYAADLYYTDVPMWCFQSVTMGSNTVNFLRHDVAPKNHGVETLYFDPTKIKGDRYEKWYNYRTREPVDLCKVIPATAMEVPEGAAGALLILEAEDALLPLQASSVRPAISEALKNSGLTEKSNKSYLSKNSDGETFVFVLEEGYVVARTWPERKYCAFDVLLWSNYAKLDVAREKLIYAVRSKLIGKTSSSFRVVTSGILGVSPGENDMRTFCPASVSEDDKAAAQPDRNGPVTQEMTDTVVTKSLAMVQDKSGVVAVVCGEEGGPCSLLEALEGPHAGKVLPIWTCPNIAKSLEATADLVEHMSTCEETLRRHLRDLVQKHGKIAGMVLAPEVPRTMGQVLHKLLSHGQNRFDLLSEQYILLSAAAAATDSPESAWRRALLDRFRMDFEKFDPAYSAQVLWNNTDVSMELGLFTVDEGFFGHLVDTIHAMETDTGLTAEIRNVRNGRNNYVPDFTPSLIASEEDYDGTDANEQWQSQQALGRQTILQFQNKNADLTKLQVEDALLSALKTSGNTADADSWHTFDIGKGNLWVSSLDRPTDVVVGLWDGRRNVDINLFTRDVSTKRHEALETTLTAVLPSLQLKARDEQPRGVGRIVLFEDEMTWA